jgi:PAS domain S-box-containing protein
MIQKNEAAKEKFKELRKMAEQSLRDQVVQRINLSDMSVDDLHHVIEELRIHQIELSMQNQQLLEAQEKLEESRRKYSDLYDFAPVGYLTLDLDGKILEANLTAVKILDTPRYSLIGSLFYRYFVMDDRDCLYLHLRKLSGDYARHTCEVRLVDKDPEVYIRLDSVLDVGRGDEKFSRTTMTDVTERKKMEIALSRSENQLKLLSSKLLETQEIERQRIAYDLHDGVAQMLAATNFYAQNLVARLPDKSDEHEILMKCIDINQKTLADLKRIVADLRPTVLDSMGIIAAIEWLSKKYQTSVPPCSIITKINVQEEQVSEDLKPVIFRILQEILSNILKHSRAEKAEISLNKFDDTLELEVKDNGRGFELSDVFFQEGSNKGIGIISMSERARGTGGFLEVLSSKNTGTTVRVRWPGSHPSSHR